ncbi:unnamed protein product [Spirodela intermedia]|uniref:Uncharacterized protein n=2 Tax=Spirodela intermedia TaxID=51605 RepID=A0A7I8JWM2_SPIIN|nr:unnamed protein product [Spirodela intermedia]CAA6653830.1 unnamed protein product [Spirodela intermedia]CAA7388230.1 unnamed protein product [Spirodela intermedia]
MASDEAMTSRLRSSMRGLAVDGGGSCESLPGRCGRRRRGAPASLMWEKEYASDPEIGSRDEVSSSSSRRHHHDGSCGGTRERRLDRAWEMKRCNDGHRGGGGGGSACVVIRQSGPGAGSIYMDMEEVKACRDLGLELPCDWTVEIPSGAFSPVSPVSISSPSSDAEDVKASLRVWAQAVALASASAAASCLSI